MQFGLALTLKTDQREITNCTVSISGDAFSSQDSRNGNSSGPGSRVEVQEGRESPFSGVAIKNSNRVCV